MAEWIEVCSTNDIEKEEVMGFEHGGKKYAIFHSPEGDFYCTDGLCTHEEVDLSTGFVEAHTIECPKHSAIFDYTNGEVMSAPACVNLNTYAVKVENDKVLIEV